MLQTRQGRHLSAAVMLLAMLAATPVKAKVQAVIVQWGEMEVGEPAGPLGPEYQEHSLGAGHEVTFERFINQNDHIPAQLCRRFRFSRLARRRARGRLARSCVGPGQPSDHHPAGWRIQRTRHSDAACHGGWGRHIVRLR